MRSRLVCGIGIASALITLTPSTRAFAQAAQLSPGATAPAPGATAPAPGAAPSAEAQDEARRRFQRALELADDGNFDAALVELRKAYELAPTYRILYNVGLVYQQLKDYARSLDTFERYLDEGGANVPEDRLKEVSGRIDRLKTRVGFLTVVVNQPGAEITVDDLVIGTSPLPKAVRVNSGSRRVTAKLSGHPPESRIIELAGGENKTVQLDVRIAPDTVAAPPRSVVPYVSWGITAALAGATAVTGVLALGAAKDYDAKTDAFGATKADIEQANSKRKTLALVTDILGGVTIAAVGVSIYFTIKPPKSSSSGSVTSGTAFEVFTTGQALGGRYRF